MVLVATTSFGSVTEFIPPSKRGQENPDVGVISSVRRDVPKLNQVGRKSVTSNSRTPADGPGSGWGLGLITLSFNQRSPG